MNNPLKTKQLTPRQAFTMMAVVLAIVLIALLIYLLLLNRPGLVETGGDETGGLKPVLSISGPGVGEFPLFERPQHVAYAPDGRIYVSDTGNNRVAVFSGGGRFLYEFGEHGVAKPLPGGVGNWEEGRLNFPLGIDVDEDGDVYVADFRNDQIQVFNPEGDFITRFPDPQEVVGKGASGQEGLGIAVTDIAVHEDKVYALDSYQVVVFSTEGEFLTQFGMPGAQPGGLDRPNGIAVAEDGTIVVSDSNHNRVNAYSKDGEFLWSEGEPITEVAEEVEHTFGLPRGLTVLEDGSILVVDTFEHQLVMLDESGSVVRRYGSRGTEPGEFNFPNGIDSLSERIIVADKENNRVQVLELLTD